MLTHDPAHVDLPRSNTGRCTNNVAAAVASRGQRRLVCAKDGLWWRWRWRQHDNWHQQWRRWGARIRQRCIVMSTRVYSGHPIDSERSRSIVHNTMLQYGFMSLRICRILLSHQRLQQRWWGVERVVSRRRTNGVWPDICGGDAVWVSGEGEKSGRHESVGLEFIIARRLDSG